MKEVEFFVTLLGSGEATIKALIQFNLEPELLDNIFL